MTTPADPSPRARRSPLRRMFTLLLAIVVLTGVGLAGIAYFMQNSVIFPRSFAGPSTIDAPPLMGAEVWWFDVGGGQRVEAWWMPAAPSTVNGPAPTVLFFHGNGELIEHNLDLARIYLSLGINVAFLEYRGYGRSGGSPSERGIVRDATMLYNKVLEQKTVDRNRIILHGRSLGGGVAAALIAHHPPAAVILESTFTSMVAMMSRYSVPPVLCRNPFRTDRALAAFDGPTLLLHGENDTIVPVSHTRELATIARRPTVITNDRDHNDFAMDASWYARTLEQFFIENAIITRKNRSR